MFSVRVAKFADAKKIARIYTGAWRISHRCQIGDVVLETRSVKRREAFWRGRFEQARGSIFVIERDDIVGFCDLIPSRDKDADPNTIAEIATISVISEHWRMGAGKALCYHVLAEARKRGYNAIILWVLASNSDAMRFCESLAFVRDGAVKIGTASNGGNLNEIRYRIKFNRAVQT
jgi:GNAT superfamily N-acetyltransferase